MALKPAERARLRQLLQKHFDLSELKDLIFDLGVDYQLFHHETIRDLSRELIVYLERRDELSCLIIEIMRHRPHSNLGHLLPKLPPCLPSKKIQVIVIEDLLPDVSELLGKLAAELGLTDEELVLVGMASGSVRLLISLPAELTDLQVLSRIHPSDDRRQNISIVPFDSLDQLRQNTWRWIICNHPPHQNGKALHPTAFWEASIQEVRAVQIRREAWSRHLLYRDIAESDRRTDMESIFGRIRSGAGRAAFEADKQRRILAVQSTIRGLRREIEQSIQRVGNAAMGLYHARRLTEPDLQQVCQETAALQAQVAAQEREIESIRQEEYIEPVYVPSVGGGAVCPNGHGAVPAGARFCPRCGAEAIFGPPPAAGGFCPSCGAALVPGASFCPSCGAAAPQPAAVQQTAAPPAVVTRAASPQQPAAGARACAHCGMPLPPGATFCGHCGRPVEAPATVEETPPQTVREVRVCAHCGTPLPPQATFCGQCGHSVEPPAPPATKPQPERVEEGSVPGPLPLDERSVCPNCGATLVPGAVFCGECGQSLDQAAEVVPPISPPVLPEEPQGPAETVEEEVTEPTEPDAGAGQCPNCGATLLPDAEFCAECGQSIDRAAEAVEPAPSLAEPEEVPEPAEAPAPERDTVAGQCPNCGAALVPEAVFCPECGQAVVQAEGLGAPVAPSTDDELPIEHRAEEPLAAAEVTDEAAETTDGEVEVAEATDICPNCGATLVPEAMFCPDCGQPIEQDTVDDLLNSGQKEAQTGA